MPICTHYQPPAPLPMITLTAHSGKLIGLDWWTDKTAKLFTGVLKSADAPLPIVTPDKLSVDAADEALLLLTIAQLDAYFAASLVQFTVPLDVSSGTVFQQQVWQALLSINYGQTVSYAYLAQMINKPTAYRACANANGRNPISLIIPCHRVIAANGDLGGYTGGTDIKAWLLRHEAGTDDMKKS